MDYELMAGCLVIVRWTSTNCVLSVAALHLYFLLNDLYTVLLLRSIYDNIVYSYTTSRI